MSVKQSLREDLAEHSYQFSRRAADWSSMSLGQVPMQFESLELHVVEALGQQDVPEYFHQPAKAITEDVSVMKGAGMSLQPFSMLGCLGTETPTWEGTRFS